MGKKKKKVVQSTRVCTVLWLCSIYSTFWNEKKSQPPYGNFKIFFHLFWASWVGFLERSSATYTHAGQEIFQEMDIIYNGGMLFVAFFSIFLLVYGVYYSENVYFHFNSLKRLATFSSSFFFLYLLPTTLAYSFLFLCLSKPFVIVLSAALLWKFQFPPCFFGHNFHTFTLPHGVFFYFASLPFTIHKKRIFLVVFLCLLNMCFKYVEWEQGTLTICIPLFSDANKLWLF